MEKLNIQFETFALIFENIDVDKYNIPYYFESDDILAIIALIFKEFMSDNHNTVRKCQNCGYYFVPSNLKSLLNIDFLFLQLALDIGLVNIVKSLKSRESALHSYISDVPNNCFI